MGRMPAKIGAQRVASLHDNPAERGLRVGRVADATAPPRPGRRVRSVAALYDTQREPGLWESGNALTVGG